jgi:hypothetical protein
MNTEFQELENRLSAMRPAKPDDGLLSRLEDAMEDRLALPTVEDARFEAMVRGAKPVKVPAELMASLESIVSATPFPLDDNIVLFTKGSAIPRFKRRYRPMAAAAAVACLGAATALFMPTSPRGGSVVENSPATHGKHPISTPGYVPASFGRNVEDASDEGVVLKDGKPHRVMKIVYKEQGSFINAEGKKVEVEQPRVEYILVPEKVD